MKLIETHFLLLTFLTKWWLSRGILHDNRLLLQLKSDTLIVAKTRDRCDWNYHVVVKLTIKKKPRRAQSFFIACYFLIIKNHCKTYILKEGNRTTSSMMSSKILTTMNVNPEKLLLLNQLGLIVWAVHQLIIF